MEQVMLGQVAFDPLVINADTFNSLYNYNIKKYIERRGSGGSSFKASYLSWGHAYKILKQELPEIMVDFEKAPDGSVAHYYGDARTASVHPFLTNGKQRTSSICFPIMDNRFGAVEEPDAREISDACQRGAVKAIAIYTGLGLPLYNGEDIPKDDSGVTTKPDADDIFDPPTESKQTYSVPAESDKIFLDVPFKKKDEAKEKGARWDKNQKKWYATAATITALEEFIIKAPEATDIVPRDNDTDATQSVEDAQADEMSPDDEDVPF